MSSSFLQDSEKRGTSPLFGESICDFCMSCVGKDLSKDVALSYYQS